MPGGQAQRGLIAALHLGSGRDVRQAAVPATPPKAHASNPMFIVDSWSGAPAELGPRLETHATRVEVQPWHKMKIRESSIISKSKQKEDP